MQHGGGGTLTVLLLCQGGSAAAADPFRGSNLCCAAHWVLFALAMPDKQVGLKLKQGNALKAEVTGQVCCMNHKSLSHSLNMGMLAGNIGCCLDRTACRQCWHPQSHQPAAPRRAAQLKIKQLVTVKGRISYDTSHLVIIP